MILYHIYRRLFSITTSRMISDSDQGNHELAWNDINFMNNSSLLAFFALLLSVNACQALLRNKYGTTLLRLQNSARRTLQPVH
jgi:hypothetical protein